MQRIPTLLKKVIEMAEKGDKNNVIDIDLMLDYTRVVYADLLEWRNRKSFVASLPVNETPAAVEDNDGEETLVSETTVEGPAPVNGNGSDKETAPVIELVVNAPAAKPAADVRQSIGINDKYLFMSELFGNNKDEYERALDKINTFTSYTEADAWFRSNITTADNNEENDTAEVFRGVLGVFFNAR